MRSPRLLSLLVAALVAPAVAASHPAAAREAAADPAYHATIAITDHGIPHITAADWGSLGYGSGYATARSSICNLADTVLTARGERSRYLGATGRYLDGVSLDASNLQVDAFVTDLRNRRVVEGLLASPAGPSARAREMVKGYTAGINRWLRDNTVTDPACADATWLKPDATELDLWYGVYLANLIASSGNFVKEIVEADPPTLQDPGLPDLGLKLPLPTTSEEVPAYAAQLSDEQREELRRSLGQDSAFGSNATAIGGDASSTGRGMLLGNPHFPWVGRYKFTQQQLTIPGVYDVAGASLIGSPVVNIGWNRDVAWSHTVSTAYRFTPYEYLTVGPGPLYLSANGLLRKAERRWVDVAVKQPDGSVRTVREDLWRTPQGYVIDSPSQFMGWSPLSFWAIRDANAEHLRTIDTFLAMGEATSSRDLLAKQDAGGGMPWVNTTAADRTGEVLYADHSVVPNVSNAKVARCLTPVGLLLKTVAGLPGLNGLLADGMCAWGTDADAQRPGIFGPGNLPAVVRRDWVMNANDSYWTPNDKVRLEGFADIIGCERCARTMRTRMVQQYVIDRLAGGGKETPESLRGHEYENRVRAAEVMRQDGRLDQVCARTGEPAACAVLAAWDGHSDVDSVGTHLFEAFVQRAPKGTELWTVPFNPADPINTPRGLRTGPAVVAAMKAAIDSVRAAGVAFDAPWGSLQVAGDRGAPAYPLGGGDGDLAGNANAVASRHPAANTDAYKAVSYGSSHIQAVSYLADGSVDARTILTYGQDEDPASPWSADQTALYSQEKWVRFAWTPQQIAQDLVESIDLAGS
ncbi:penicillin acylase family protein [Nocardioides nitrophenolicus]|uniref:penicillin acylase family protein n=1 Tax=Nocardioides nitrophenolicus TaxID=60489 RepID=UPI00195B2FB0|nr:penicillin acylase family protein [Nocardioides nitrophenolicus]MBM7515930.1 acyl-homoserine-lactone acylase [Nocardioides nitrophenolicus]